MLRRHFLFSALTLPGLSAVAHAGAQLRYNARLICGGTQGGVWRAGLDLALDKGWKTYWRMPGDAGVPPMFDCPDNGPVELIRKFGLVLTLSPEIRVCEKV